jgi:hypothetical protein
MPVNSTHPSYDDLRPVWERARDFLEGERAVKRKGIRYLAKLKDQEPEEYEYYKERAKFLNATARTHEGLVGQIFLKDPVWTIPDSLAFMEEDSDMAGATLWAYCRRCVAEVLAVGRGATLVDWSEDEERAYLSFFEAEAICNWRFERLNGRQMLTMVVLKEFGDSPLTVGRADEFKDHRINRLRVLSMKPEGVDGLPVYTVEIYEPNDAGKKGATEWALVSKSVPTRAGNPLEFIPLVWHNQTRVPEELPKPPLDDLIALNVAHYRLGADLYHGLHFVALPTPWVAGFESKAGQELRVGCGVAWVSDNPAAKAGFLEFSGTGLGAIKVEMDGIRAEMAVMGARLLETQKREAEAAEAMQIRQGGESSVLTALSGGISESIEQVLKVCLWWTDGKIKDLTDVPDDAVSVELNSDFTSARMTSGEITALTSSWLQGAISHDTLLWNFKQGEIIPPDKDAEDELDDIKREVPKGMDLNVTEDDDDDGDGDDGDDGDGKAAPSAGQGE